MKGSTGLGCVLAIVVLSVTAAAGQQARADRDPVVSSQVVPRAAVVPARVGLPVSRQAGRTPNPGPTLDRWAARTAAAAGIPEAAARAYGRASLQAPTGCHLGWTTLAGIGWVESQHGTIGGRSVDADGRSSAAILGPALDGGDRVAAIPSTPDSIAWHGDADWDHAVGPMQFIPSTWETWASDGDDDGVADPHDLDDAAAAAARYLCHGGDLAVDGGWARAVFSYNHSDEYVLQVLHAADTYAARTTAA